MRRQAERRRTMWRSNETGVPTSRRSAGVRSSLWVLRYRSQEHANPAARGGVVRSFRRRAVDQSGELLAEPQTEEAALQLLRRGARMTAPQAGHGEGSRGLDGIVHELHLAPGGHAAEDLQLDPLGLGVGVQRQGRVGDLVGLGHMGARRGGSQ